MSTSSEQQLTSTYLSCHPSSRRAAPASRASTQLSQIQWQTWSSKECPRTHSLPWTSSPFRQLVESGPNRFGLTGATSCHTSYGAFSELQFEMRRKRASAARQTSSLSALYNTVN